jgi:hypothetical protein
MKEVNGKTAGEKSTVVAGNLVRCVHTTLHKATDVNWQLTTTFDFEGVSQENILKLASETLVIRWRHAFKNAKEVDETADNQIVLVNKMLRGSRPRMSKAERFTRTLADMTPAEKQALLKQLAADQGIEIDLPEVDDENDQV